MASHRWRLRPNADTNRYANADTNRYANTDGNTADANPYRDTDAADTYTYCDGDSHAATPNADTKAAAHAVPAADAVSENGLKS